MTLLTNTKEFEEVENKIPETENKEQENKTEEKENASFDDGGENDLLKGLMGETDKDADKSTFNNSSSPESSTNATVTNSRPSKVIFQNHELVAKMTVAALNVAMGMLLQFISDNWSEEAEKKYTLSANRKKEIEEPLVLMLEQSKSKYNPVVILVITVLVSYVPLFINAFRERREKANKKKIKHTVNEIANNSEEAKPIKEQVNEEVIILKKDSKIATTANLKRIKSIRAKKGRRSLADTLFMNEMTKAGLI